MNSNWMPRDDSETDNPKSPRVGQLVRGYPRGIKHKFLCCHMNLLHAALTSSSQLPSSLKAFFSVLSRLLVSTPSPVHTSTTLFLLAENARSRGSTKLMPQRHGSRQGLQVSSSIATTLWLVVPCRPCMRRDQGTLCREMLALISTLAAVIVRQGMTLGVRRDGHGRTAFVVAERGVAE